MARWHRMLGEPTLYMPGTRPRRDHRAEGGRGRAREERDRRAHDLGREKFLERDVEVDGPLPAAHREAAASSRMLAGLVAPELHDGAVQAARRAHALHPAAQARSSLPRRSHRALVPALPDDVLGPRVGAHRAHRPALLTCVTRGPTRSPATRRSIIATTRPETIVADVAVAVHPDDDRWKTFIGREVLVPIIERRVKVIADEAVDPKLRHRRAEDHARPRRDGLRDRSAPQPAGHQRHRHARCDDARRRSARRARPRHRPPYGGRDAARTAVCSRRSSRSRTPSACTTAARPWTSRW